jgi:hypothetical protein
MKYRKFIEDNFLIDEPKSGKLVPFVFNPVQNKYYDELIREYDIENKGISSPAREIILKARREGFSSFVLALFAADDILQENPTETLAVSYKDDATKTFRTRYRRYILSYAARKMGYSVEQIQTNVNLLEEVAKTFLSIDANDIELKHNKAHFYCGTASARTGGRGGVLQKALFSEAAHYPDTENMTATEIVEGTAQQIDKASGWIFIESTANGRGNYYEQTWTKAVQGLVRYRPRFYGWRDFYSEEQFKVIASEFIDSDMLKQEYPETPEEAFLASGLNFTSEKELEALVRMDKPRKELLFWLELQGTNYIDQCEILLSQLQVLARENPNRNLYAGIDVAKSRDKTVLTVLRDNLPVGVGGIKAVAIDSTGAGDFMPDWFEKNSRLYTLPIKFSVQQKDALYKLLSTVIQDKLTSLPLIKENLDYVSPEAQNFWTELLYLQKEIKGNLMVVSHPKGDYHDDHPDSWALAEYGYYFINGFPKKDRPQHLELEANPVNLLLNNKISAVPNANTSYK